MDAILQGQLDRVETALTTLTDSISSYNPSVPAAQNLLAADDELQQGLKQLHTHQKNHARIQELRTTIDRQNAQISLHMQLLTNTRASLLALPGFRRPKEQREVESAELLDFGKRISRFSMPSSLRKGKATIGPIDDAAAKDRDAAAGEGVKELDGIGLESLKEEEKQWLDPWTGVQYTPWPSDEMFRSSALVLLQAEGEKGEEMEGVEGTQGTIARETESTKQEEESKKAPPLANLPESRPVFEKKERPKVFGGLDLYDPDAED